jgi:flagella basal body P-ring formation protein FlgA
MNIFRRTGARAMSILAALALIATAAGAHQDSAPVRKAVEDFLRIQTRGLPGDVSFTVGGLDAANQLAPCSAFEVSLPPGARAWGHVNVTVRCQAERGWSVFLPVQVRVVAEHLVAALPVAQGQTITGADLGRQRGDLAELPAGILTNPQQAIGRTAKLAIVAGRPLRADMLQQPLAVQQNQTVRVLSTGQGFQVSNEGKALNNGVDGQIVQVRLASGQIVSGVARAGGVVEINF